MGSARNLALRDTVPVMTGYLFLGFGFGILMQQSGYGFWYAVGMSICIYAGSMQYVAVGLLTSGAGLLTTAMTTLLVNARHLFYGSSMVERYKGAGKKKPYLIFALTDETYSLVSGRVLPEGIDFHQYCFWVSLFDQCYWVAGTALGALVGSILSFELPGVEFVLTALFVCIFTEQWLSTRDHRPALVGGGPTVLCLIVFGKDVFLIPSMALIALVLYRMKEVDSHA